MGPAPAAERIPDPLRVYEELGFLTGDERFAAVGRFVFAPGPGDSSYAILALSLPNSALRFRRAPPGFVARYEIDVSVGDSSATVARLNEVQEVRIRTFRETARRDESVVSQSFLTVPPGDYPAHVRVSDVASGAGLSADLELRVPRFAAPMITAPIVVYRVQPRTSRDRAPSFILSPRATLEFGRPVNSQVYIETLSAGERSVVLEARQAGEVVWSDTLAPAPDADTLGSLSAALDTVRLPPGALSLQARLAGTEIVDSTTLLVALAPDWLAADYEGALDYLRYAGTPAALEDLRGAPPRERARLLHAFWSSKDLDRETVENEFFQGYFRRIREANARFGEPKTAGWLTDRGAVYVSLGPPDEVLRDLDARGGPERSQVWLYTESLGFEVRLVFTDESGSGAFRLTADSRHTLAAAVETLQP
ncbi:MAG: GWxTD domain-containing protein [Gemmatimonadales bacterium]|jgi:GWxTD domain-containing protein